MLEMKNKILIISYSKDLHADYIENSLKKKGVKYFRFNTDQYPHNVECVAEISDQIKNKVFIKEKENIISSDEIKSVIYFPAAFIRPNRYDVDEFATDVIKDFIIQESDLVLPMIFEGFRHCFWVNHPDKINLSKNKMQQLKLARMIGFLIPKTLITNSPETAKEFILKNQTDGINTVLKTMGGITKDKDGKRVSVGSPVRKINELDLSKHHAPMFLQQYIEKKFELRITIVGQKIFPCEIHSQLSPNSFTRTDWRVHDFDNVVYKNHILPKEIEEKCFSMMKTFGLQYSAIDMILTPDNKYVFLELNSHGLWQWVEVLTGMPISDTLADLLISPP